MPTQRSHCCRLYIAMLGAVAMPHNRQAQPDGQFSIACSLGALPAVFDMTVDWDAYMADDTLQGSPVFGRAPAMLPHEPPAIQPRA